MKKANVWGILSVLVLSLFIASVVAADDDLPEPLNVEPPVHLKGK